MRPRYSLITTCAKRWSFLMRSLPSWRNMGGNIFIVTYAFDSVPKQGLEREHVIVVQGETQFHRTRALNAGALVAKKLDAAPYLLFIDADVTIKDPRLMVAPLLTAQAPDFVLDSPHALGHESGEASRESDPSGQMRGLRGTHWVKRELFFKVGGFNQRMRGWGYDDIELYRRYARQSNQVAYYERRALFHQPHDDRARASLQRETLQQSQAHNRAIALSAADPLGESWAKELGYPNVRLRFPTQPVQPPRS